MVALAVSWMGTWMGAMVTRVASQGGENGLKPGIFYGMELPRVGAFTDFRGSGYRNPVQK